MANATKTWLVVKDANLASATSAFLGTNVNITSEGRPHLGAPLGTETYVAQSIQKKVAKWCLQLQTLCSIAITQPHAIFAAFTHSVVHQWTYLARTVSNISTFFTPIEDIIRSNLIPSLTGRAPPGDLEPHQSVSHWVWCFNDSHKAIIRPHPAKENTLSTVYLRHKSRPKNNFINRSNSKPKTQQPIYYHSCLSLPRDQWSLLIRRVLPAG